MSQSNWKLAFVGVGLVASFVGCGGSSPPPKQQQAIKPVVDATGGSGGSSMSAASQKSNANRKEGVGVDSELFYPVGPLAARMLARRDDLGGPIAWPPVSEWGLKEMAADALARIGADAVPELVSALNDSNPQVRLQAARALARIGPDAAPAVQALTEHLTDVNPLVRQNAARALGQIGPRAKSAVPDLIRALQPEQK